MVLKPEVRFEFESKAGGIEIQRTGTMTYSGVSGVVRLGGLPDNGPHTLTLRYEMKAIRRKEEPCPFRVELLAALERTLCFCHTGNTAVLATSLMNRLGLSAGIMKDGYPMLHQVFKQPTIRMAMAHGFEMKPQEWPLKDGIPRSLQGGHKP